MVCVEESLVGNYVVVEYDGIPYPGIILGVDENELDVKVSLISSSGPNTCHFGPPYHTSDVTYVHNMFIYIYLYLF